MKPGTRIVSNSFTMGDWQADQTQDATEKEGCTAYCTAYLWIVPAKVEGKWKLPDGELVLKQTFQNVSGSLGKGDGASTQVSKGVVRGDEISFSAGGARIHREGRRRHDDGHGEDRDEQQRVHRHTIIRK